MCCDNMCKLRSGGPPGADWQYGGYQGGGWWAGGSACGGGAVLPLCFLSAPAALC